MYSQDITRAMSTIVGQEGVSEPVLKRAVARAVIAAAAMKEQPLPVVERVLNNDDLAEIEALAAKIRDRFSTVIVFGMGGSSLSGKMLSALDYNPFTGLCGNVRLMFVENIDPHTIDQLLATIDFATSCMLFISKSGGTGETMAQATIFWQAAQGKLGVKAREHFICITQMQDSPLRRFAVQHELLCLEHPSTIGGRYAALTLVGLLPAAIAGLNIRKVRKGAAQVIEEMFTQGEASAPVLGAALSYALSEQGKYIFVQMPYADRLSVFAQWHRQIWAESLGKKGKGITPVPALGATDQHSQTQLYLDGPRDKFFTLFFTAHHGKGATIPVVQDAALGYLAQHPIGDLIDAQQYATMETLTRRQCPVRLLMVPELNEEALGALTMHFMLETILTGGLMEIDPFDQPSVEESKKLTVERLSAVQ